MLENDVDASLFRTADRDLVLSSHPCKSVLCFVSLGKALNHFSVNCFFFRIIFSFDINISKGCDLKLVLKKL